jgi:hypothetical protein
MVMSKQKNTEKGIEKTHQEQVDKENSVKQFNI